MRKLIVLIFCLVCLQGFSANKYFKSGADNNWSTGGNWYTDSTFATNTAIPGTTDDVYLTYAAGAVTCDVNSLAYCNNFICKGFTGTLTGTQTLRIYGTVFTLGVNMTNSYTGLPSFRATSGTVNITTNGVTVSNITLGSAASTAAWTLVNNLTLSSSITVTTGTLDLNGKTLTTPIFSSSNANTRGLTSSAAGGVLIITGTGTTPYTVANGTFNVTNPQNFTVRFTGKPGTTAAYALGGKTYGNLDISISSGDTTKTITITGSNTFSEFKVGTPKTKILFTDGTATTITSLNATGTAGNFIVFRGTSTGGWTMTATTGNICGDYLKISYSTANGGASFYAGANSSNNGGNSGWNFTACPAGGAPTPPYMLISY